MRCPKCGGSKSGSVVDSRQAEDGNVSIRRRRESEEMPASFYNL